MATTMSRSLRESRAFSSSSAPSRTVSSPIPASWSTNRRLSAFRASSTIPIVTWPNAPRLSAPKMSMNMSGSRRLKNTALRSRTYARRSIAV